MRCHLQRDQHNSEPAAGLIHGSQRTELTKAMKVLAVALKSDKKKRYSQAKIAGMMGVTQQCVSQWLDADASNTTGCNACLPDLRQKVTPAAKADIVVRIKAGETQRAVADDYKVSRGDPLRTEAGWRGPRTDPQGGGNETAG